MRQARIKIIRQQIQNKLDKYDRRIQQMAENAYKLRQFLQQLDQQENDNALRETGRSEVAGSGNTNSDTGESQLPDNTPAEAVLAEQPTELSSNQ